MYGKGYGMPSSHAQFVAFFAVSLSLFLLLRHVPSISTSYSPSKLTERALLSLLACCCASAVAASRVYLNYHTVKQVLVGIAAGALWGGLWFIFTTILRRYGWIDWALDNSLARMLRMRDLITTEDLVDAGWGRFEARRKARQAEINGSTKKVL
jgi:dolichyldiphosphatase